MDESWQRPPGLVLRTTPQLHPRVTHFPDEDDGIVFETSSVEPDLPPNSDPSLIDKQDHSEDNIQDDCSVREDNRDQPCTSLKESLRAQIDFDSKKRKPPTASVFLPAKKARLDEDTSRRPQSSGCWLLPAEIWQYIFVLLPPKMLGRLLSVNKCFNSFLNPLSGYSCDAQLPLLTGSVSTLKPEVIWQLSRRRFWPTMPTPLRDHTELQMWQLACQSECQFCGRTDQLAPPSAYDPSNDEYKHTGPRPIWSFALRSSAIQEELNSVRAMGEATAEEWLKGLEGRGKEHRADSLRWEKFEMFGGLIRMRQHLSSDNIRVNSKINEAINVLPVEKRGDPLELSGNIASSKTALATPIASFTPFQHQICSLVNVLRSTTREEAEEMKAVRRAEIERRAAELEPPLSAHLLALIPSFHAAIQITSPLDDTAWNLLKPRLIAHQEDMDHEQHRKQETSAHSRASLKQSDDPGSLQRITLEAKQKADKTWDDAQAPLRARISALADKLIRDSWGNGRKINKESSPRFAVEVLLYVRRRFYSEIEKDDAAAQATGQTPPREAPHGPYTRKLTLENMKWLFDVKVKPLTESYRKELFYCHGCEVNTKLYGFEGVIQHYAAKHTNCLSLGSVVVHWRAEWPEVPPFHPEPHNLKNQRAGVPKHKPNGVLGPMALAPLVQLFHEGGAVPNYGQSMPHVQYDGVPIQPLHGQISPYMAPVREYAYPFQGQIFQPPSNLFLNETAYYGPPGVFHGEGLYRPVQAAHVDVYQSHSYAPHQDPAELELQFSYHVQSPNTYYAKLEDIARNSRELWFSIAPVRELLGPVRIFVVIHHVSARFRTRFSEEPPLSLFMDGLSNNKEMRPIRKVNGLQCKVCCLGLGIITPANQDKESFSLPQLVKHFHQRHFKPQYATGAPMLNWHTNMIHLPDLRILSNLGSLTNIDNRKLILIHSALSAATARSSQLHAARGINTLLLDHKSSDRRHHSSAVHSSNQRALVHQPHIRQKGVFRDTSKRNLEARNVDKVISEMMQPNSYSTEPHNSGIISRPSESKAGHQPIDEAPVHIRATSDTSLSIEIPAVQRSSLPISLPRSHNWELPKGAENDEDDDFDLMAGLESQLDQQASSIGTSNPPGPNN
ncbi:hypothetical protein E0Z10_g6049 [Xylaria hypoxylon]|uniref:DUF7892 domain-containing protein n=1 Tax=Xylaria hypoxylon TaxID=37992 RepID=A0A4Z0YF82_9PEZI|nr:hypothetical protein E0Z10_g6049 [Xylaria hypoxylon]